MGVSSQPRKNPYVAQGLLPGTTLQIALVNWEDEDPLVTRVESVSEEQIEVLVPMKKLQLRPLASGEVLRASYMHRQRPFCFMTEVVGDASGGALQCLRSPGLIESPDRREAFRLETSIPPLSLYRLVIDAARLAEFGDNSLEGTVVDLGESGLCLSSSASVRVGERLGIHASLGEAGEFMARMQITEIVGPRAGQRNRRLHCRFTDISPADADRIARFLIRRQLELRRRGQL